jgi:CBS domain-containing protein
MPNVNDILRVKGNHVWTVEPDATIYEALRIMADKDIGALVVMKDEKLMGIISERDYARRVMLKGKSSRDTKVEEVMTKKIYCVKPDHSMEETMALMSQQHVRHLPVHEGEKIIGLVSIGDAVSKIISDQAITIQHLKDFIMRG